MFATVALLGAALSGFGIAAPPAPSPPRENVAARNPNGPAPWLAPTLPPYEPPKRERARGVKRRSKVERLQRRKKRKQRSS